MKPISKLLLYDFNFSTLLEGIENIDDAAVDDFYDRQEWYKGAAKRYQQKYIDKDPERYKAMMRRIMARAYARDPDKFRRRARDAYKNHTDYWRNYYLLNREKILTKKRERDRLKREARQAALDQSERQETDFTKAAASRAASRGE